MPRYIDADALKDVIQQHDYPLSDKLNSIGNGMFTLGIFQAIDQMPTIYPDEVRGAGKWISVVERLPVAGERVLVSNGGFVCESFLSKSGKWQRGGVDMFFMTPTHWCEMPEPPKEENKR